MCETWNNFIENQKVFWTRIIEAHINPQLKSWHEFLKTSDVETLFEMASTVQNYYNDNQYIREDFNPLHFAAINEDVKIVKRLIEKETHQKSIEDVLWSPLHCAAQYGKLEAYQFITKYFVQINPVDDEDYTPLHLAAKHGHLNLCQFIIENVTDKNPENIRDEFEEGGGVTPLHEAAINGSLAI